MSSQAGHQPSFASSVFPVPQEHGPAVRPLRLLLEHVEGLQDDHGELGDVADDACGDVGREGGELREGWGAEVLADPPGVIGRQLR